jgi:hypothetical protein
MPLRQHARFPADRRTALVLKTVRSLVRGSPAAIIPAVLAVLVPAITGSRVVRFGHSSLFLRCLNVLVPVITAL